MKVLEIDNIYKKFGENTIHNGISFQLNEGERVAILGPSGTGKSVLLREIIGLDSIDSGKIIYKGTRIDSLTEIELNLVRLKIAYSFQNAALFDSINVFENLAYSLRMHKQLTEKEINQQVDTALKRINLLNSKFLMPSSLSGGMKKRVGMARATMLKPDIILYDEPTAGLDPHNITNIIQLMKSYQQEHPSAASLFVTHDIEAARALCERFILLKNGKVFFDGSVNDLDNQNLLEKFFEE